MDLDNNTRFFHTMVNKRKHSNTINVLSDSDVIFRKVASTSNPVFTNNVFDVIPKIITESDNVILNIIPTDSEIESVVKSMPPWSSPGPDGFQAGLCNVSYKIISKILANRIKPYLKKLISPYQAAFVPGREIHDNIIISHEMIHSMKHKEGYSGTMALKLNLSKAFDRFEWNFLNEILLKFGFRTDFCNLIMQCVTTTNICVLLNGSTCNQFEPTRGISQGDPLSPYIFILAMEYLSRSLLISETNKTLTGVKVSRKAPAISHFLFADDILIFGQADMQHVNEILKLLQNFGTLSGQMLNFDKSCVYFSHNLNLEYCEFLVGSLQMSVVTDSEKYLGAPLLLGHSKLKSFDPIVQSFEARLKKLSYQMACFKIPTTLLSKLDSLQLNFWWGHKTGKGIKFVAWDSINQVKELGGLEILKLLILLSFAKKLNENCSWIWRGIYKCIDIIKDSSFWAIGCGTRTKIWLDSWVIGLHHPHIPADGLVNTVSYTFVSDLFIENTRFWNVHLIYYLFDKDCAEKIINMFVPATGKDNLIRLPDRKGQFNVKSIYNVLSTMNIIPTRDKLSSYKTGIETHCSLCNHVVESCDHLFLDFPYARSVWLAVNINVSTVLTQHGSFRNWVISWFSVGAQLVFGSGITRDEINKTIMVQRWRPPDPGFLKINLDASFMHFNSQGVIGLIFRDFAGTCIGVQGKYFDGGMKKGIEAEELECRAMLASVTFASNGNYNKEVFESDSEVVVKSINEQTSYVHWINNHFILDIKYLLEKLDEWKCISVKRDANGVADKLAKKARTSKSSFTYQSVLPRDVKEWIDMDYNVNS
ncbi:uncharacterized protein LOC113280350 [Papaver somniferum]|uniref:uncharacterized protein LOC113280350 n=1 Tax=Papaver somniferum TaxID=3469 RepID=UPI000E7043AE|nr:uncharacterized protein LOC113280350 [Papaver somniferum]